MCDNRGIGVKHVPLLLTCELFIFSIYSRSYTRHNTLGAKNSDTFRYGVGEGGGRRWGVQPIVFSIWSSVANSPLLYHWWRHLGVCPVGYLFDTSSVSGLPEATRLARRGNYASLHKFFIVTSCCNKISFLRFCLPVIGVLDPLLLQRWTSSTRQCPSLTRPHCLCHFNTTHKECERSWN